MREQCSLEISPQIDGQLASTRWRAWISPPRGPTDLPIVSRDAGKRTKFAHWLNEHVDLGGKGPTNGKGLYLWTLEEGDVLRFVHVGISARGNSSLRERTKVHLRNQILLTDRVHNWTSLPDDQFGTLGSDLRTSEWVEGARDSFLERLRVIYLFPEVEKHFDSDQLAKNILRLEGIIARTGAYLLDLEERENEKNWETTNTLSRTAAWTPNDANAEALAISLNDLASKLVKMNVRLLPAMRRSKRTQ